MDRFQQQSDFRFWVIADSVAQPGIWVFESLTVLSNLQLQRDVGTHLLELLQTKTHENKTKMYILIFEPSFHTMLFEFIRDLQYQFTL